MYPQDVMEEHTRRKVSTVTLRTKRYDEAIKYTLYRLKHSNSPQTVFGGVSVTT